MATKPTQPPGNNQGTTQQTNPFANIDFSSFDASKMMSDLKLSGVDMQALLAAQRKNIEALTAANQLVVQGMQNVAKRQSEILAQAMAEVATAAQQLASAGSPQERTAKQTELSQRAFEKALANMRELAEMISQSNTQAFEVVNQRVSESLEDLKNLVSKQ